MDELFRCLYCEYESRQFCDIIDHMIIRHPDQNLKIKIILKREKDIKSYSKNFNLIPSDLKSKRQFITPVEKNKTLNISRLPELSPFGKCPRMSTPVKSIHDAPDINVIEMCDNEEDLSAVFYEMQLDYLEKSVSVQTDPTITFS